jgi:hypothetical protein
MRNLIAEIGCRIIEGLAIFTLIAVAYGISYLFNKENAAQTATTIIAVLALYRVWKLESRLDKNERIH